MANEKIFIGHRIRRLRKERGLTQARMAEDLGISTSYLNLIERDQRPITASFLIRLADAYDVDIKKFTGDAEAHALAGLHEVFRDPFFEGHGISQQELQDVTKASPEASQAILSLYQAYREVTADAAEYAARLVTQDSRVGRESLRFPAEEVREFLREHQNHFPALEDAAMEFIERTEIDQRDHLHGLQRYLSGSPHDISVEITPENKLKGILRSYDRHRRRILLSEFLPRSGRAFQLAVQIAFLDFGDLLDRLVGSANPADEETRKLCRISLANYFAACVMMPYQAFLSAAEDTRYDIEILCRRFGASFEQVCHRLTTLQRPSARGVPFFMIRIDNAGNVSKRFSAGTFQFARLGGACPRWNVHDAFQIPGRTFTQIIQMPEGMTYLSIARTVDRYGAGFPSGDLKLAIGLGCEISYARRLVYADGYDVENKPIVTPIGINCRLCDRADCRQRALPPMNRHLHFDENRREFSPYTFSD